MFQDSAKVTPNHIIEDGFRYWQSIKGNNLVPKWSDFDPAAIKPLLPHIVVIHVLNDPLDFVERITGDTILSHSSKNSMGRNWRTYEGRGPDSKIWKTMEDVVQTKQPNFQTIPYVGPQNAFKEIQTVVLPMSEDGQTVSRTVTFVEYIEKSEAQLEQEALSLYSARKS
ncbi:PAS domain-containing protein [Sneathiella limimaris]|uniref:PAS domain-containing protein n=1 Tax=Sneathiella limimaris TaxID=1964213 RepID=UPI0019CF84B7|nr:PAS domain-containing protein [Sneathiella limimaris]